MTALASLIRLLLLVVALVLTGLTSMPTGMALANAPGGGSCQNDCGCDPGWNGCCLLPNGAVCHRS
jgi:hypothetical protein